MKRNQKGGIMQGFLIIILVIIILSLLGVSLSSFFNDKTLRENFEFVWNGIGWLWNTYAEGAWQWLREYIFLPIKNKIF